MSRKRRAPKRKLINDPKYGSPVVSKLINKMMYGGKKTTAEKIIYDALDKIKEKTKEDPMKIFNEAIKNVKPNLEVRSRRVGGATYQVPTEVRHERRMALSMRWIIQAARARSGRPMARRLAEEFMEASRGQGTAVKRKEDLHRMAEANKAFSHFAW